MDDELGCEVPFRFGYCDGYNDPEEDSTSSEDELDIILHGTPEQKRKLSRSLSRGSLQLSSSEDDFEKEMETELDMTMKKHEMQFMAGVQSRMNAERDSRSHLTTNPTTNQESQAEMSEAVRPAAAPQQRSTVQQFYDDIYFDSDDEDGEGKDRTTKDGGESSATDTKKEKKQKRRIPTNDELLYDPNIDDDNQNWMNKQRAHYYPRKNKKPTQGSASSGNESNDAANEDKQEQSSQATDSKATLPKTDAVLNCPACMTTLCIDCQRHELYANQFRAMFVVNCCIIRNEQLRYPVSKKKRRWRKKRKHDEDENESEAGTSSDELYHPVKCSVCNTEVAVLDKDDVFHFFNVLSSAA